MEVIFVLEKTKLDRRNLSVLGILVRVARLNKGYSLRQLSSLTNISHTLISNIEKGKQPPAEATLSDIFAVLDLKLYASEEIQKDMSYYYKTIFTHLLNHEYPDAEKALKEMEKKGEQYKYSFEVVNYIIIRCLFYTLTNTYLEAKDEELARYEKVLEFFSPEQKQLFYFIKGLDYLNLDNYKLASDNFEKALTMGNKNLDVIIKEYLVEAYIHQYKFTDGLSIAQEAIEVFELKTIYTRAMKCRILIAKVYLKILKLDQTQKLVDYVDSFATQFKFKILTDECRILKAEILFFKKNYSGAIKELELHSEQSSSELILPRFRSYLMGKDERLFNYYNEIISNDKNRITRSKYLLIKVLMLWIHEGIRDDVEYVDSLNELTQIAVEANNQEIIGLAHNLLIIFYREKRKYKKALEVADQLLMLKKIHISYYAVGK